LERIYNLKAGLDPREDTLPKRLLEEPMPEGPQKGNTVRLEQMLPEYYRVRGWDEKGLPRKETLSRLGIDNL